LGQGGVTSHQSSGDFWLTSHSGDWRCNSGNMNTSLEDLFGDWGSLLKTLSNIVHHVAEVESEILDLVWLCKLKLLELPLGQGGVTSHESSGNFWLTSQSSNWGCNSGDMDTGLEDILGDWSSLLETLSNIVHHMAEVESEILDLVWLNFICSKLLETNVLHETVSHFGSLSNFWMTSSSTDHWGNLGSNVGDLLGNWSSLLDAMSNIVHHMAEVESEILNFVCSKLLETDVLHETVSNLGSLSNFWHTSNSTYNWSN